MIRDLKYQMESKLTKLRIFHRNLCKQNEILNNEKEQWRRESERISQTYQIDNIVDLNVGGTHNISTSLQTLQSVQNSGLSAMFSGRHNLPTVETDKSRIFIDRDGETFSEIINYLRNTRREMPVFDSENKAQMFSCELDFWGIETFEEQKDKELLKLFPKSIINIFEQEPRVSEKMVEIWREIGPLNLAMVHKNCETDSIGVDIHIDFEKSIKSQGMTNNGNTFEGQVNADGRPHGLYRFINKNPETIFEGQWISNGAHGYGRIIWKDGNYYIGHWKNAKLNGYGKYVFKDSGIVREGQWINDAFIGDDEN